MLPMLTAYFTVESSDMSAMMASAGGIFTDLKLYIFTIGAVLLALIVLQSVIHSLKN